jgi:hypothetical protein
VTTTEEAGLETLPAALADIVCWLVFFLQRCSEDEVDPDVAEELQRMIGDALRKLPVADRLAFLEHAAQRASGSSVEDYHHFLIELAETLGLE